MSHLLKRSLYLTLGVVLALFLALAHTLAPTLLGLGTAQSAVEQSQHGHATDLLNAGRSAYQNQQIDDAIRAWQAAAQDFDQQGDRPQQALALSYLSMAYQYQGDWSRAEAAIAQSLEQLNQWRAGRETTRESSERTLIIQGQVLNTQGTLQFEQGAMAAALETWRQSGLLYQRAGDIQRYTGSLINQARTLQTLGYFLQARDTLTDVRAQLDQVDPALRVLGLHSLGDTLRAIGDLEAAEAVYTEGLEIAEAQSLRRERSALLLSLGHIQRYQQPAAALDLYRQAAAVAPSPLQRAQANVDKLGVLIQTESWDAAATLAVALQPQIKALPPSRASLYAKANFAHRLIQSQQTSFVEEAAALLTAVVQQAQDLGDAYAQSYALGYLGNAYEMTQQWSNAQELTEKALLVAQGINAPDIAYQWQWQLGRILKAQNQIDGAIAAYRTAFLSLQSLRYDLASIAPDQQFSFRESVEPVYRDYVDLLLRPDADPNPEQLQQARDVIESLQIAELNNFFRSTCVEEQAVALDDVDQTDAAIIYPIILSDRIEVIASLPNQPLQRHTATVPRDQVDATLDALRQNLVRPFVTPEGKALGEEVYGWLLRPIAEDLSQSGVSTLVFVLDGSLRSVPMAALFNGDRYLIEDYSIALTPGLQLIAPRPLQQRGIETLAGGLTEARHGFSTLVNVNQELETVESTVPSRVLLNQDFTSEALREQVEALPYPVVHLATHGQFSSRADETFILAWDKPLNVNEISAILQTASQARQIPIELLILSACETAAGDERAALGLAGVAVQAGARSTIASLWNLDDASGAVLVGHLYSALVKTNTSKAEALRQAQLALLNDPDYRAPTFWSPFVLVGNWL